MPKKVKFNQLEIRYRIIDAKLIPESHSNSQKSLIERDESNKQLVGEKIEPLPAEPGQPERYDYQYERNGTA